MTGEMDEAIRRLVLWARGEKVGPETVQIYPTNVCNLKCIYCCQVLGDYDFRDTVPPERWISVAHELVDLDVRNVLISGGGEPLSIPQVTLPLMRIFKKAGMKGRMINNGTLWKQEMIEETVDLGWDDIVFSLDGPDALTHDFLRGVTGAFHRTIRCIRSFNEAKGGDPDRSPKIELTCVLSVHNYKTVPGLIQLAKDLGIRNVTVEPVCVNNPEVEKMKLTEAQRIRFFEESLSRAEELAEKYDISTNFFKLRDVKTIEKAGDMGEAILAAADERDEGPSPPADGAAMSESAPAPEAEFTGGGGPAEDRREAPEREVRNELGAPESSGAEGPAPESVRPPAREIDPLGFLTYPCYEPWIWPKIEANGEVWPCSTNPLKVNIKDQSFTEIWYGEVLEAFRQRIRERKLTDSCSNCVVTHLATNREISRQLRAALESGQE